MDEDIDQEALCDFCETNVIGGPRMSYHFMCEGCYCELAAEMFIEAREDDEYYRISKEIIGMIEEILEGK